MNKININYSELIKKFEEVLTSTSRGFDTEVEFLESWVPNPEINQSIRDLINAALDYETKNFQVSFEKNEQEKIDLLNLKKAFEKKLKINLENKVLYIKSL
ncbi:MAG: hypothetical protein CL869_00950 [Cytophagia bacterium]|nr:hypothetical protein [Cytophagia bacterium]|tara:strand:+ start:93 stop:395 length:303 start_codon:yes stop_codon:yes gene_type:complete